MTSILDERLAAQLLSTHPLANVDDVVRHMGAIQAQDDNAWRWAVGVRLPPGATERDVLAALDDGRVVRTHAFRSTWQVMAREDVGWIVDLVGAGVLRKAARRHEELGLDDKTLAACARLIKETLETRKTATRVELADVLEQGRISTEGQRLSHILGAMELKGLMASGPRRGKQHAYALLDTPAERLSRGEAAARLAARYRRSRGAATLADFTWWSGLAAAEAKAAWAATESEAHVDAVRAKGTWLLPAFDEYLIAYKDRSAMLDLEHAPRVNKGGGLLDPIVVLDGRAVGTWKRTLKKARVEVEVKWFVDEVTPKKKDLAAAVDAYGAFLGMDAALV